MQLIRGKWSIHFILTLCWKQGYIVALFIYSYIFTNWLAAYILSAPTYLMLNTVCVNSQWQMGSALVCISNAWSSRVWLLGSSWQNLWNSICIQSSRRACAKLWVKNTGDCLLSYFVQQHLCEMNIVNTKDVVHATSAKAEASIITMKSKGKSSHLHCQLTHLHCQLTDTWILGDGTGGNLASASVPGGEPEKIYGN